MGADKGAHVASKETWHILADIMHIRQTPLGLNTMFFMVRQGLCQFHAVRRILGLYK